MRNQISYLIALILALSVLAALSVQKPNPKDLTSKLLLS